MLISLHSQATTTPRVRALIRASTEPARVLAERYGTTAQTIWKWRKRDIVQDRSPTPHRLRIPGPSGQGFRFDPATHSNLIRPPIPGYPVTLSG